MHLDGQTHVLDRTLQVLEACHRPHSLDGFRETVLDGLLASDFEAGLFWLTPRPDDAGIEATDPLPRRIPGRDLDRYLAGPWTADPFTSPAAVRLLHKQPVVTLRDIVIDADTDQRRYLRTFFAARGYRDQATTWLPTGTSRHGFVTVVTRRPITAPERELLARLRPHLAALLRWQLLAGRATPGFDALSPRQQEVATLAAAGESNREIARALGLSEETVKKHLTRVYAALGCRSRAQLAAALRY